MSHFPELILILSGTTSVFSYWWKGWISEDTAYTLLFVLLAFAIVTTWFGVSIFRERWRVPTTIASLALFGLSIADGDIRLSALLAGLVAGFALMVFGLYYMAAGAFRGKGQPRKGGSAAFGWAMIGIGFLFFTFRHYLPNLPSSPPVSSEDCPGKTQTIDLTTAWYPVNPGIKCHMQIQLVSGVILIGNSSRVAEVHTTSPPNTTDGISLEYARAKSETARVTVLLCPYRSYVMPWGTCVPRSPELHEQ
jgi:hypothetical protein